MRCPAWCDRVLWRAPNGYVTQHTYDDCGALLHSDHRPVGTRFTVQADLVGRLTPESAAEARQGMQRLERFLSQLGHAPRSRASSTEAAAAAADDDLDREDELRFFQRNVSLIVLRPEELKAELEVAHAAVQWFVDT